MGLFTETFADARKRLMSLFVPKQTYGSPPSLDGVDDSQEKFANYLYGNSPERGQREKDYHRMDETVVEISGALDMYAEDATLTDSTRDRTIWVTSPNTQTSTVGNVLFDRLRMEDRIFSIARETAKFGGHPYYLALGKDPEKQGVVGLVSVDRSALNIKTDYATGDITGFEYGSAPQVASGRQKMKLYKPWEFIYYRIFGSSGGFHWGNRADLEAYGYSMIEPARTISKTLNSIELAIVITRLVRAGSKKVYYVPVGTSNQEEALKVMKKFKQQMKRYKFINPGTGAVNESLNMLTLTEDLYIPIYSGTSEQQARVETLSDDFQANQFEDIRYFSDKLFSALKIPKEYMNRGDGGQLWNSNLAYKDIRYARTAKKLQRSIKYTSKRLVQVELALRGMPYNPESFEIGMSPVSNLEEAQKWEAMEAVSRLASELANLGQILEVPNKDDWRDMVVGIILKALSPMVDVSKFNMKLEQAQAIGLEELHDLIQEVLPYDKQGDIRDGLRQIADIIRKS